MKKWLFIIFFFFNFYTIYAEHIIGGEMSYTYVGVGSIPNTHLYKITLKIYRGQTGAALDNVIPITVYNNLIGTVQALKYATLEGPFPTNYFAAGPCISPPQSIMYEYGLYTAIFELQESAFGYLAIYQRCCRKASIQNLDKPSTQGASYFTRIPGKLNTTPSSVINSSPVFVNNDSSAVCRGSRFSLDFSARDEIDGDILSYSFGSAYQGGGTSGGGQKCDQYTPNPGCYKFDACIYKNGFSSNSPMGPNVSINSTTGIVSGIAPGVGQYVVTVICNETRGAIIINSSYKEFLVTVFDCAVLTAQLNTIPTNCENTTINFKNDALNVGLNPDFFWDFGEPSSGANNTSTLAEPSHSYLLAGDYTVKLKVSIAGECTDSTQTIVKIYPGFRPNFEVVGQCNNSLIQFRDLTQADYGIVNQWSWSFGDPFASPPNGNTSTVQNPTHTYILANDYDIVFNVSTSKGCTESLLKKISILPNPALIVNPIDTLICTVDTLQLEAIGNGTFEWTPDYNINSLTSNKPLVSPDVTTTYTVVLTDDFGCKSKKSTLINVVDKVTQGNNYDTTICQTDVIQLKLFSNALKFLWQPNNSTLNDSTLKNPLAKPLNYTSYLVTGKISDKCFAQNTINVKPIPYPKPIAADVNVCIGNSTQLQATGASIYNWSPRVYLSSTIVSNPLVTNPVSSVLYTLTVRDTLGCPKPVQKIVKLNVIKIVAKINAKDTSVIIGQPLQLIASGGTIYEWLPINTWLNNVSIPNPIALLKNDITYTVKVSDVNGCTDKTSINVKVYNVKPSLYVPNAFTPNNDNKNDYFKPIPLGIKSIDLFQIYNRWGQLIYSNTSVQTGWDGKIAGRLQDPATYIWIAEATDYTGKKIKQKGSFILIR